MGTGRPEELGDETLVTLAQKGEHKAFEELVERYKQKAYRIAFDFTRDREEAKDLSQEAFLRAFTHLNGFDQRASFYTWFYRILVNLCLDYRRRGQRVSWQPFEEHDGKTAEKNEIANPGPSPDREAMSGEISRKIGAALNSLPPKQRTAFVLKNHEGLSIREIAKIMQTAEGTVKTHIHRAVLALRQSLAELV
ncbi:MAG: sigma-70 family RNA polymerase sigma factor [Deltaproteobacteria bacterium]|nr:MAG: sigma-70 family RNA polymerase sigma factor [Deltaproteobacteria bacterium]